MARETRSVSEVDPRKQLAIWIDRYDPTMARLARAVLRKMEQRLPGATELVYDNYNALVIGFGPNQRASDCPFSIAVYARWVNLYFLEGRLLSDPEGLLQGTGIGCGTSRCDRPLISTNPESRRSSPRP